MRVRQHQPAEDTIVHVLLKHRMRVVEPIAQVHALVGSAVLIHQP